ncbi:Eco57I restriction-modification methylase domain-containing protein [Hymenobacter rubripertinctus]|uniref:site-specific DNA-methyltransferase (adenine-specific) n=1 Tax=Hymenobacter rubripertinctus TaxID=2029981 RepID=A0A418R898_9BACT|nr:N-6 DNA methylase [Hymenobacter rubripertinctus]RIY13758.1 SAM-dependent DNA methyltransferase [Hymenobacter rubripertinctus]
MLKSSKFNKLLNLYDLTQVERHLVHAYLNKRQLEIAQSQILTEYFEGFSVELGLQDEINKWAPNDIKELESYLELIIPVEDRKLNGAFFTPSYIVDYIISEVNPGYNDRNLDPSCGSGAFLVGLARYYKATFGKSVRGAVIENIYGADILDYNIDRAKVLLTLYALEEGEILLSTDFNLFNHDTLRVDWNLTFHNIIGNPPYVKFQDLSTENRGFLSKGWETVKGGAFNLYFAFFELGYKLLTDDGILAFITPNNYFTSLAGEQLRSFFERHRCVYKVVDFSHKKVFDALTYTAITFLNKKVNDLIAYDRLDKNRSPQIFLGALDSSNVAYESLVTKKWRLLKGSEVQAIHAIENSGLPLGKLFDINVGIATLKDDVFFVDGTTLEDEFYLKSTPNGQYKIEIAITRPVYKISDFKTQEDIDNNSRKVIFPYNELNGGVTPISEEEMGQQYPECYRYLKSEEKQLLARDKAKVKFDPFYVWGRTQGLVKKGLKVVTPTFSQFPRFLKIEQSNSYFTNGYAIFFKTQSISLFANNANEIVLPENIDVLQKLLNSVVMDYYVKKTSVSIDGGYPCYQKNFIQKFSVPIFTQEEIIAIRNAQKPQADAIFIQKYQLNLLLGNLD